MYLVINKMAQFEHVDITNGNFIIKTLTGTSVKETDFAVYRQTSPFKLFLYFLVGSAIKNRSFKLHSEFFSCPTQ